MPSVRYLLDTNIVSDLIRNPRGEVAEHIARVGEQHICTSIVVASELRFGARKSGSPRLQQKLMQILNEIEILSLEPPADHHYASIRAHLEARGTPIGPNDMLIAAHARANGMVMVTRNVAEFSRVPELTIENWLE